jgi:hypothetical protein
MVLICSGVLFFLYIKCIKNTIFLSQPFIQHLSDSYADSILYNFGGSSVHNIRLKALTQAICPRDFRVAWSLFCSGDLFFLYIKCLKKNIFLSQPFKHHLSDSNADSILYMFGGSPVRNVRLKALTQAICPRDFRVAWSFLDR